MISWSIGILLFVVGFTIPFVLACVINAKKSTKDRKDLLKDFVNSHVLHDPSYEEYCELINLLRKGREENND